MCIVAYASNDAKWQNSVKKEKRLEYYNALDKAHTTGDYTDFVKMVNELEIEMLNKYLKLL